MARLKSKTPRLLVIVSVLLVLAAGLTIGFKEEAGKMKSFVTGKLKGFMGKEDTDYSGESEYRDITVEKGSISEEDELEMNMETSEREKKVKKKDFSALAMGEKEQKSGMSSEEDDVAQEYIEKAQSFLSEYNFTQAAVSAETVLGLSCSDPLKKKAEYLKKKAEAVETLSSGVKPNVTSDFENVKIVVLANNRTLKGRVKENIDNTVTIITDNNMKVKLDRNKIKSIQAVKTEDEKAKLVEVFEDQLNRAESRRTPLAFYRTGIYALENRLKDRGYSALFKAFDMAYKQGGLLRMVREDEARTVLAQGIWQDDTGNVKMAKKYYLDCIRDYKGTKAAKKAEKFYNYTVKREKKRKLAKKRKAEKAESSSLLKERSTELETEKEPEASADFVEDSRYGSEVDSKLAQGDKYYDQAMQHMKVAYKHRPSSKSNSEFKKAEKLFNKAIDIYAEVNKNHQYPEIEIKIEKAQEMKYNSIKLRTMG